MTGAKINQL